ncbi:hypothetical protein FKM82_012602 [Ascaphus truei]
MLKDLQKHTEKTRKLNKYHSYILVIIGTLYIIKLKGMSMKRHSRFALCHLLSKHCLIYRVCQTKKAFINSAKTLNELLQSKIYNDRSVN